jgi:exodeoxyribonuclease VII small subunit
MPETDNETGGGSETGGDGIGTMSFEQALEALERIVDDLERGDVPLDQSIRIYERGEALKKHCDALLKAAEDKVEKIRLSRDGTPAGTEPLDGE